MTKEEASLAIDKIQVALNSGRRVGITHREKLWLIESTRPLSKGDYEFKCRNFAATEYFRHFNLVLLSPEDIFISL